MTRLIYLTDTHLGAVEGRGYHQQPRYTDRLPMLLTVLDAWIAAEAQVAGREPIAFVLHGGDMVDQVTAETLHRARETFQLRVPVYLSLGNHDLTAPDSLALWLREAPSFFPGGDPCYTLPLDGGMLHVVPTQWCDQPYFWETIQRPHWLPEHAAQVTMHVATHPGRVHLVHTHGEVLPVPPAQIGQSEPYHPPPDVFSEQVLDLVRRYPQVACVLGGHNHINTHGNIEGCHVVTASAFTEVPFEFKVIEVTAEGCAMMTVALWPYLDVAVDYNWDKTFVQGRACDRAFSTKPGL